MPQLMNREASQRQTVVHEEATSNGTGHLIPCLHRCHYHRHYRRQYLPIFHHPRPL